MRCAAKDDKVILRSSCLACTEKAVKVSILIINNSKSLHLEKVLQSIYRQLLDNVEIIVLDGDAEKLCDKYEVRYEPVSIDEALKLVTGQIVVTTYSNIYQFGDCLDVLVAPLLADESVICLGKIKIDDGSFLEAVETRDYDNVEIWKKCLSAATKLLYAMHVSSISSPKGKYIDTDAWAIDLGDK